MSVTVLCCLVKLLRRYGHFSIFQDGGCPHLGFLEVEFLMFGMFWRVSFVYRAKFSADRSNHCGDMFFVYSRLWPSATLDF